MKISSHFVGEKEWLPEFLFIFCYGNIWAGQAGMPQWAHLPLILKPDEMVAEQARQNRWLPVFAMDWTDLKRVKKPIGFEGVDFA